MEMLKRFKVVRGDGESDLPEHIIQYIQSFLDSKQAARTTVLSKSWHQAWLTRPKLDINELNFRTGGTTAFERAMDAQSFWFFTKSKIERYEELNLKIETLRLQVPESGGFGFVFNELITKVADMGIQDLELVSDSLQFALDYQVLQAETLVRLAVKKWAILGPTADQVKLSKLKSLTMECVEIRGDCYSLIFPCLEDLTMKHCLVTQAIHISSGSLKFIRLEFISKLDGKFEVPNIQKFELLECCYPTRFPRVTISTSSNEWEANISFLYRSSTRLGPSWPSLLKRFLNKLATSKIYLSFNFEYRDVICGYGEFQGRHGPVVENLTIAIQSIPENFLHFLTGLIWCCRPKFITLNRHFCLFTEQEEEANNSFKQFMTKEVFREEGSCCLGIRRMFTNRGLAAVSLEYFDSTRGGWEPLHLYALWYSENKQNIRFRFEWLT